MRQIRYQFHTEWCADKGQLYSHPHYFEVAGDARNAHSGAMEFHWAKEYLRPSVTDLYAVTLDIDDATGRSMAVSRDIIADGKVWEGEAQKPLEEVPF